MDIFDFDYPTGEQSSNTGRRRRRRLKCEDVTSKKNNRLYHSTRQVGNLENKKPISPRRKIQDENYYMEKKKQPAECSLATATKTGTTKKNSNDQKQSSDDEFDFHIQHSEENPSSSFHSRTNLDENELSERKRRRKILSEELRESVDSNISSRTSNSYNSSRTTKSNDSSSISSNCNIRTGKGGKTKAARLRWLQRKKWEDIEKSVRFSMQEQEVNLTNNSDSGSSSGSNISTTGTGVRKRNNNRRIREKPSSQKFLQHKQENRSLLTSLEDEGEPSSQNTAEFSEESKHDSVNNRTLIDSNSDDGHNSIVDSYHQKGFSDDSKRDTTFRREENVSSPEDTSLSSQTSTNAVVAEKKKKNSRKPRRKRAYYGSNSKSLNEKENADTTEDNLNNNIEQNISNQQSNFTLLSTSNAEDSHEDAKKHCNEGNENEEDYSDGILSEENKSDDGRVNLIGQKRNRRNDEFTDDIECNSYCNSPLVVKGAGANVFAVQDAGSYRMIQDECLYLCSTILSAAKNKNNIIDESLSESLWELAFMLSEKKNRFILWTLMETKNSKEGYTDPPGGNTAVKKKNQDHNHDALDSILQLFSLFTTLSMEPSSLSSSDPSSKAISMNDDTDSADDSSAAKSSTLSEIDSSSYCSSSIVSSLSTANCISKKVLDPTKMGRRRRRQRNEGKRNIEGKMCGIKEGSEFIASKKAAAGVLPTPSSDKNIKVNRVMITSAHQALTAILYLLSWDCTTSASSCANSPTLARKIRSAILEHSTALRSMAQLAMIVRDIESFNKHDEDSKRRKETPIADLKSSLTISTYQAIQQEDNEDDADDFSSAISSSSQDSERKMSPTKNKDPTCSGRRHRRLKRQLNGNTATSSSLLRSPVVEDEDNVRVSPKKKTKNMDGSASPSSFISSTVSSEIERLSFDAEEQHTDLSINAKNTATIVPDDEIEDRTVHNELSCGTDSSSLSSLPQIALRVCDKLPQLSWTDKDDKDMPMFRFMASESLSRIIQGKDPNGGEGTSCLVNHEDDNDDNDDSAGKDDAMDDEGIKVAGATSSSNATMTEEERRQFNNPLFITNRLLLQSGALPIFARTMSNFLDQFLRDCFRQRCGTDEKSNNRYYRGIKRRPKKESSAATLFYYRRQITTMASLLDGACLFSDLNRIELCKNGALIHSLIQVLYSAAAYGPESRSHSSSLIDLDILLVCLRTLTSLTHDNDLAGRQMQKQHRINKLDFKTHNTSGIYKSTKQTGTETLLTLLYQMVRIMKMACNNNDSGTERVKTSNSYDKKVDDENSHLRYDVIVFCLNTLTNIVESANLPEVLSTQFIPQWEEQKNDSYPNGEDEMPSSYLRWLTKWIVSETAPFRESVMNELFGKTNNNNHHLDSKSEEHLVTAGNGFILLACLMIKASNSSLSLSKRICQSILLQMPTSSSMLPLDAVADTVNQGGYTLMINTLKSFCNLYYYSVGDLSVAVVAPVKKLLEELETMKKKTNASFSVSPPQ